MRTGRSRPARLVRWVLTTGVLAAAVLLLSPAAPATAHAYLTDSNPADGASLTTAPAALRLQFSESVDLAATRVDVVDGDGRRYRPSRVHIVRGEDTEEPASIVADLPRLPRGVYHVSWETLSSDDLHRTSGVLSFGIGRPGPRTAFHEPLPRGEEALLRWALFASIAAALGGLLGAGLFRRGDARSPVARRCVRLALFGAAAGAIVAVGLLADQVTRSGEAAGRVLTGDYGRRWLLREAGLVLLLAAAWRSARPGARHARAVLVTVGAGAVGLGSALLGHAAAGPGAGPTAVGADALHLLAAATWSGTVIVVALLAGSRSTSAGTALRRFALPAAGCVSVVVATGLYLASGVVGSVDAAVLTWYGRALLAKVALFLVVGGLGLANHRRLRQERRSARGRLRLLSAEAIVAALVLGIAAFLTSAQPAREPEFVARRGPAAVPFADARVADLQERLRVGPNRPGRDVVLLDVLDTRRPSPGPVTAVRVRALDAAGTPSSAANARPLAQRGRWSAVLTLTASGRIELEVTVLRAGLAPVRHRFAWVVAGGPGRTRPATLSTAPVADTVRGFALLMTVLLAAAWCAVGLRRGRPRPALSGERGPTAGAVPDKVPVGTG